MNKNVGTVPKYSRKDFDHLVEPAGNFRRLDSIPLQKLENLLPDSPAKYVINDGSETLVHRQLKCFSYRIPHGMASLRYVIFSIAG